MRFAQLLTTSRFLSSVKQTNVRDALKHWTKVFEKNDIPEPDLSVEHLMAYVLDFKRIGRVHEVQNDNLTTEQMKNLEKCCECRLARMPVQYIIKQWDFRTLNLMLTPPVFIPRPETEELVDLILDYVKKKKLKTNYFLDVGCGSGAIVLSLLRELPEVEMGVAIDRSYLACLVTKNNAKLLNEERLMLLNAELSESGTIVLPANVTNKIDDLQFDFIVSNPPYVPTKKLVNLEPEIKLYEDLRALDGGVDGMKLIKPLMIYSAKKLAHSGSLFMEVDESQPNLIKNWVDSNYDKYKLKLVKIVKDFANKDRFIHIIRE